MIPIVWKLLLQRLLHFQCFCVVVVWPHTFSVAVCRCSRSFAPFQTWVKPNAHLKTGVNFSPCKRDYGLQPVQIQHQENAFRIRFWAACGEPWIVDHCGTTSKFPKAKHCLFDREYAFEMRVFGSCCRLSRQRPSLKCVNWGCCGVVAEGSSGWYLGGEVQQDAFYGVQDQEVRSEPR